MPRTLPPLNALRAFEAAGRHGSFSAAAAELGVSHSSISRHVRGLEQRLGVQLFREAARGVALSPEGRAYLGQVSPVFDALSEATEAVTGRASGVITVSSEPTFATHWIMPRLGGFLDAFPDVEPRITATTSLADLASFEADVAIRSILRTVPDQPSAVISDAPMYPFANPKVFGHIDRPEELVMCPRLQDRRGDPWRDWFALVGVELPEAPPSKFRLRANLAIPAAIAGQAVLLVSADVVDTYVRQGSLVRLFDVPLWSGSYQVLIEAQAARRRAVRQFRDWLISEGAPFRSGRDGGADACPAN